MAWQTCGTSCRIKCPFSESLDVHSNNKVRRDGSRHCELVSIQCDSLRGHETDKAAADSLRGREADRAAAEHPSRFGGTNTWDFMADILPQESPLGVHSNIARGTHTWEIMPYETKALDGYCTSDTSARDINQETILIKPH